VVYVASDKALESDGLFAELRDRYYGGMADPDRLLQTA
jgi:hypothetical protein